MPSRDCESSRSKIKVTSQIIWKLAKKKISPDVVNFVSLFDTVPGRTDASSSGDQSRHVEAKETTTISPIRLPIQIDRATSEDLQMCYILNAMMEFTISLSFSCKALTAFFLDTLACCMTSSMSLLSKPVSSTSSSSSSSSFFASLVSIALPLP